MPRQRLQQRHFQRHRARIRATCAALACALTFVTPVPPALAADPAAIPDEPLAEQRGSVVRHEGGELVEEPIAASDRQHWAFRPLARPPAPATSDAAWPRNDIDRFVLALAERDGLTPQQSADRAALLRRVTFDLVGLPPTPDALADFLADDSAGAYDAVVDRLLASPSYGERWGQHWLDLARFAETDGFEHDKIRAEAWRYRDWVIDALNRDLPLDEFIRLQIAGDELRPDDPDAAVATGFLLAGPDMPDINLKEERRHMALNEITSTVGAVFLGLQIGCAQCHDHKYDPISQADFYRLRAIFETADLFGKSAAGRAVRESGQTQKSFLAIRGDFRRAGPELEPALPRVVNLSGATIPATPENSKGSGRRTALARWLTAADQPLTSRVLVNWIWQQHFGAGLSRTPGDFGVMGDEPDHPELLDWLATELMRDGWSLKRLHRQIVTSATYRQASRPQSSEWTVAQTAAAAANWRRSCEADPDNRLLARRHRRRLEGEAIRDAMLASADRLSPGRGGPGVMAPLPQALVATLLKGQWKVSEDAESHRRRSVYLFVRRNLRYPLFEAFDRPDTNASCPRRDVSTTAPQALAMLNSEFSLSAARDLADYVQSNAGCDCERVELLYRRTLGRAPTDDERRAAEKFVAADGDWVALCLAMFNLNEFVYVD